MSKFFVDIHRFGELNNPITTMIARHNEGSSTLELETLRAWVMAEKAHRLNAFRDVNVSPVEMGDQEKSITISEDAGEFPTLTITQKF